MSYAGLDEIQASYESGEFDDDPEISGLRKSRQQQEALERETRPKQRKPTRASLAEQVFVSPAVQLTGKRTLADVELELAAGRYGYRPEPWLGPDGPMAIPEVSDDPKRFKALIDAWRKNKSGYEAELRHRGLIR